MRVFVLGAGASHDAGYPLAREMGHCLAGWIKSLPSENQHHGYLEQIVGVYGGLDDFESILADLMTCSPGSRAATLGTDRPYLLSDLQEAIRDYFDEIRPKLAPGYDKLAHILRRGDVVITFNYDLGLERALRAAKLWDIKTGYGFSIDGQEPSPVEVLKLHGSTNWRALLFGGRTRGSFVGNAAPLGNRPVLFFRPDIEYLGYSDFADPLCAGLDRAASLPEMILPALPKQFGHDSAWKAFWDDLWNRAENAIKNAAELVVIGYSLPDADERARSMLRGTANKSVRLSICCGKATAGIEQLFRDNKFSNIVPIATTFEDFVARYREAERTDLLAEACHRTQTLPRLRALIGKQGRLFAGGVGFTFLDVYPAANLPKETSDEAIETAITLSQFLVHFDDGIFIDGSDRVIPGSYISLIRGRY
jgi:hypothetical protein